MSRQIRHNVEDGKDPDDCGHGEDCGECEWKGSHWHRKTYGGMQFNYSGCCACPEHNPVHSGSLSPEPVVFEGASGLTVKFTSVAAGVPEPLGSGPLPAEGVVYVTGLTPSASPHDRSANFIRYDPSMPATYYEVDSFTVMSLDLQTDVNLDGSVGGDADAPALAADWDREGLIPSSDTWRPVKVFNDVALPGVYTLAVDGSR